MILMKDITAKLNPPVNANWQLANWLVNWKNEKLALTVNV